MSNGGLFGFGPVASVPVGVDIDHVPSGPPPTTIYYTADGGLLAFGPVASIRVAEGPETIATPVVVEQLLGRRVQPWELALPWPYAEPGTERLQMLKERLEVLQQQHEITKDKSDFASVAERQAAMRALQQAIAEEELMLIMVAMA